MENITDIPCEVERIYRYMCACVRPRGKHITRVKQFSQSIILSYPIKSHIVSYLANRRQEAVLRFQSEQIILEYLLLNGSQVINVSDVQCRKVQCWVQMLLTRIEFRCKQDHALFRLIMTCLKDYKQRLSKYGFVNFC